MHALAVYHKFKLEVVKWLAFQTVCEFYSQCQSQTATELDDLTRISSPQGNGLSRVKEWYTTSVTVVNHMLRQNATAAWGPPHDLSKGSIYEVTDLWWTGSHMLP